MEPGLLFIIAILIIVVVVQVVIVRWILRVNEIVTALNEQTDYLEDIAFRLKKCAEKMGVYDSLDEHKTTKG